MGGQGYSVSPFEQVLSPVVMLPPLLSASPFFLKTLVSCRWHLIPLMAAPSWLQISQWVLSLASGVAARCLECLERTK